MSDVKVACIGAGMMGGALMKAVAKVVGGKNLTVSDGDFSKAQAYAEEVGCQAVASNGAAAQAAQVIFLAVKPFLIQKVVEEITPHLSGKILVSMAAGLKLDSIREACSVADAVQWVRIMPNLPAVVGEAMIGLCGAAETSCEALEQVKNLLSAAGKVEIVEEKLMDAVTAISGSGPAYCFLFIEALADAAVLHGLPRELSYALASQMIVGTGKMQRESGAHPGAMKDAVCSPGGTTIVGVASLERNGFRSAVIDAIDAVMKK